MFTWDAGKKGEREKGERGKAEMISKADIEKAYAAIENRVQHACRCAVRVQ